MDFHQASKEQLSTLFEHIHIHTDSAFTIGKLPFEVTASTLARSDAFNDPLAGLILRLTEALYMLGYARRFDPAAESMPPEEVRSPDILASLETANPCKDGWHYDWVVSSVTPGGSILASRGDQLRTFQAGEYINEMGPDRVPQKGDPIRVYAHAASTHVQSLFYFVFGSTIQEESTKPFPFRVYWNIDISGAELLLEQVVTTLNRWQIPFRFKISVSPQIYQRTDSAVLYLEKENVGYALPFIREIADRVQNYLSVDLPLFTEPLVKGVGIAETPITGGSFGMHRCELVARSIVEAYKNNQNSLADRFAWLKEFFWKNHIDPLRPHLNAITPRERISST